MINEDTTNGEKSKKLASNGYSLKQTLEPRILFAGSVAAAAHHAHKDAHHADHTHANTEAKDNVNTPTPAATTSTPAIADFNAFLNHNNNQNLNSMNEKVNQWFNHDHHKDNKDNLKIQTNEYNAHIFSLTNLNSVKLTNNTNEILFIDPSVKDFQQIINQLNPNPNLRIFFLNSSSNGFDQITQALGYQQNIGSIFILSNKVNGEYQLGNTVVSEQSLESHMAQISQWENILTSQASITLINDAFATKTNLLINDLNAQSSIYNQNINSGILKDNVTESISNGVLLVDPTFSIGEDSTIGTQVGFLNISGNSYQILGTGASDFAISGTSIVTNRNLDYELTSSYNLTINALNTSGQIVATEAALINVIDAAPRFATSTTASVNDLAAAGSVAYTAITVDRENDAGETPITYTIGGTDAGFFSISSSAGVGTVRLLAAADFESKPSYSITVTATNQSGLNVTQNVTINVKDIPVFTSASTLSIGEETPIGTAVYTAITDDPATFSLSSDTLGWFSLNTTTGVLTMNKLLDYEAMSGIHSENINIFATNAVGTNSITIPVTITDVPVIISGPTTVSFADNTLTSTVLANWSEVESTNSSVAETGAGFSWAISGTDAGSFSINSSTSQLTLRSTADYETQQHSYSINVTATTSTGIVTTYGPITLTMTDVAPSITSSTGAGVSENATTSTTLYTVQVSDTESGTVTYSLGTALDESYFNINSTTGVVTFKQSTLDNPGIDPGNGKSTFNILVEASTASGATSTKAVTITVNEAAPVFTLGNNPTISLSEDSFSYTPQLVDPESDSGEHMGWALVGGADLTKFNINTSTGTLTLKTAVDYETTAQKVYHVSIRATPSPDPGGTSTTQNLTINLIDTAPVLTSSTTATVAENVVGTVYTATVSDPETDAGETPVTYSITGGADAGLFSVSSSNGVGSVTFFNYTPDYSVQNVFHFTVQAKNQGLLTNSEDVILSLTSVKPIFTSASSGSFSEDVVSTVFTAAATDPLNGAIAYSISGGTDAGLFNIDGSSGAISFKSNVIHDYELQHLYNLIIQAANQSSFRTQALALTMNDVAPVITTPNIATVQGNSPISNVILTGSAVDAESGAIIYSLGGTDANYLNVNSITNAITFRTSPVFGSKNTYNFDLIATNPSGVFSTENIEITITAPPVITVNSGSNSDHTMAGLIITQNVVPIHSNISTESAVNNSNLAINTSASAHNEASALPIPVVTNASALANKSATATASATSSGSATASTSAENISIQNNVPSENSTAVTSVSNEGAALMNKGANTSGNDSQASPIRAIIEKFMFGLGASANKEAANQSAAGLSAQTLTSDKALTATTLLGAISNARASDILPLTKASTGETIVGTEHAQRIEVSSEKQSVIIQQSFAHINTGFNEQYNNLLNDFGLKSRDAA